MAKTVIRYHVPPTPPDGSYRLMRYELRARVRHPGQRHWTDYGVISDRIVTDAAIADLISVMLGGPATALQNYRYHASGTSAVAESAADTALGAEVETRETGTQTAPGPGQYQTVATHTYAGTYTIREHGVFSSATGGVLLDRSVFSGIAVVPGTDIEWTYTLTITGS